MVNGLALDPADISGDITGNVSLGDCYQPYVGFGWGRKADDDPGLSLTIEIGVALLDPVSDLSATAAGTTLTQAELDTRINFAENDINDGLSLFEAWPVISLGLNYAF